MRMIEDVTGENAMHLYALRRSLLKAVFEAIHEVLLDDGEPVDEWTDEEMGRNGTVYRGDWVAAEAQYIVKRLTERKQYIIADWPEGN